MATTEEVIDFNLERLKKKHKELDEKIWELENKDIGETHTKITELKKEKLQIKDKIALMESKVG